jgi:regulator of protease activity HflC (stomatin/prohibitin superfamily)
VAYVPVEVRRVRIPRRTAAGFVIAILIFLVAAVILSLSVYSLPAGVVAVVVDPVSGQISKPVMGPAVGFKAPWAYLIEDTYASRGDRVRPEGEGGEEVGIQRSRGPH